MPIEVDHDERLADIARATVEIARERGTRAVTLRAVAERLGRSTAFITNYVPSRAHLMANALEQARGQWDEERAAHLGDLVGVERLAALARWMCTSSPEENVLRSLWIEVIADVRGANRRAYEVVRGVTDATYGKFLAGAEHIAQGGEPVDHDEAAHIADILYLYCRGYEVKAIEDPGAWTDERVQASLEVLLATLVLDRRPS
ncbi:TetR family transcriptional regulator [Agromyces sp. H3Y2-19a]|uniref:TetR/AcrR family transcriptional regulator n=1 Tax=Agromyces TaxID=33877 RepID=UPI001E615BCB|nr:MULTISPECIES: TetR family transcriptional regulator [Agromyces]MCD5348168.1 TetR family transcriptional regulator [Agromyces sp. S2-1-8]MDF0514228.1 TetR family transcriptional regulator [Agromyces chromiiresistens]